MRPKVYIETTIISYLTARPRRDLVTAAHQQLTREWWDERDQFDLYTSKAVHDEAADGDPEAAQLRLKALEGVALIKPDPKEITLASHLLQDGLLPEKATEDALHIAIAAVHGMHYLLTWNCKHIANVVMCPQS